MNSLNKVNYASYSNTAANGEQMPAPPLSLNQLKRISIEPLNKGYVVTVGCQSVAISSKTELLEKLIKYINEQDKTEKAYYEGELFKD